MIGFKYILLNTNILLYRADEVSPHYETAKSLIGKGFAGGIHLCVCPQVLVEFFSVVTNPKRMTGKPLEPKEALEEVKRILYSENIAMICPEGDALNKTIELSEKYVLKGPKIFDAQIVATMLSNGVEQIYTFDKGFSMFEEIEALIPGN